MTWAQTAADSPVSSGNDWWIQAMEALRDIGMVCTQQTWDRRDMSSIFLLGWFSGILTRFFSKHTKVGLGLSVLKLFRAGVAEDSVQIWLRLESLPRSGLIGACRGLPWRADICRCQSERITWPGAESISFQWRCSDDPKQPTIRKKKGKQYEIISQT